MGLVSSQVSQQVREEPEIGAGALPAPVATLFVCSENRQWICFSYFLSTEEKTVKLHVLIM